MNQPPAAIDSAIGLSVRPGNAAVLYQGWLDNVARAIWDGNFATVGAAMHYPHTMKTEDGQVVFDSADKLCEAAEHFRDYLQQIGAQAYMRLCTSAAFIDGNTRIDGEHTTYILRGGSFLVPPFGNTMTLILSDGQWLGAGIRAGCTNHHCTILSPAQLRRQHLAADNPDILED